MLRELWLESKQPNYDNIELSRLVEFAQVQSEVLSQLAEKQSFGVQFDELDVDQAIEMMTRARDAMKAVGKMKPGPTRAKHNKRVLSYFSQIQAAVKRMLKQSNAATATAGSEEEEVDIDRFIDQHFGKFDDLPLPPEEDPDVRRMQNDRRSAGVNKDVEDIDKEIYGYDFDDEDEELHTEPSRPTGRSQYRPDPTGEEIPGGDVPGEDGLPDPEMGSDRPKSMEHGCCCRCRCCDDESNIGTIGESLFKRTFTDYLFENSNENSRFVMDSHEYSIQVSAKGRGEQHLLVTNADGTQLAKATVNYDVEQITVDADLPHPAEISYFEFVDDMDNVDWIDLAKAVVAAVEY